MTEPTAEQMRRCLQEIAADKLAPLFITEKAKRVLLGLPDIRPLDGCRYQ